MTHLTGYLCCSAKHASAKSRVAVVPKRERESCVRIPTAPDPNSPLLCSTLPSVSEPPLPKHTLMEVFP